MAPSVEQDNSQLIQKVLEKETGRTRLKGIPRAVCLVVPFIWSLFQLWIVSPIPYSLGIGVFNDTATRCIHLSFAVFLAYIGFPILRRKSRDPVPFYDWGLALLAAFCSAYLYLFQGSLVTRAGIPAPQDIAVACVGVSLLLEATRRVMGLPMTIVAIVFLTYVFAGPHMPDLIAHKGASLSRAASQFWLTSEGVFGVPLGVSTSFVFLYVLFGALLERAGAGDYLTSLSFSLLGHLRGGPAKAAVVASGLHGLISGSSIANVLTCGPVTIMLMKKVGFSAEKAGAVEVAAGSNGQIMPPVMGAAAFLMVEYINMPYSELIKHAFVPALLAYGSLLYIVHLEACKLGMKGLERTTPFKARLIGWGLTLSLLVVIIGTLHYLMAWIPAVFGGAAWAVFGLLLLAAYLVLVMISARQPDLPKHTDEDALMHLPAVRPILVSGLHFLIPIAVLVWCLMIFEMSPGLAAFYACAFMIAILLTHRPLVALLRKQPMVPAFHRACALLLEALTAGGRNMVGIALATASAGIVVGAVSLTGVGQALASVVEAISMGSLTIVLFMTALLSIILGMGLPTTANYIIVSTLLAPVIYNLSGAHGLAVPLVAVHLFCLYFGVMADATPPVALAAFAAAGISGGDPFRTGVQGFIYEMRTAVLPFVFLFNPEILLIGIRSIPHLLWVLLTAALACMAFASALQRFMLTHTRWWEVVLLVVSMMFLFRPGITQDYFFPPYLELPASQVEQTIASLPKDGTMRLKVHSEIDGKPRDRVIALSAGGTGSAADRLYESGLTLERQGDALVVADIAPNSRAEKLGLDIADDHTVEGILMPDENRPGKAFFSIPGLVLFILVYLNQRRARRRELAPAA